MMMMDWKLLDSSASWTATLLGIFVRIRYNGSRDMLCTVIAPVRRLE